VNITLYVVLSNLPTPDGSSLYRSYFHKYNSDTFFFSDQHTLNTVELVV